MSSRTLAVSVLVRLVDQLTGPWRALSRTVGSLANLGRQIGVLGAAVAGLSFVAPLNAAASFDQKLRDIAVTAGETGAAAERAIDKMSRSYERLALKVGQRSNSVADAAQVLISAGLDQGLIDRLLPAVGRVSTAASADIRDTARVALSLSQSLKIPADQMELALAKLVTAGKLGRFEFKQMAAELPGLTAQLANLGVTGQEAVAFVGAALQTAMRGTDSPSEAANNLKNFLQKVAAPDARKNFKEIGVDIVRVMADATATGINPIEAVVQKLITKLRVPKKEIDAILKKAKADGMTDQQAAAEVRKRVEQIIAGTRIGEVYADAQVLGFLLPFIQNVNDFVENKVKIREATEQVVSDDFATQMRGLTQQLAGLAETAEQMTRRIGRAFATNLPMVNYVLAEIVGRINSIDEASPGFIDSLIAWGGAAMLGLGALALIGIVAPAVVAGLGVIASAVGLLASAYGLLNAALVAATRGFLAAGIAMMATPVGWVVAGVAAIAAAAYLIYRNWDGVAAFFAKLWTDVKQAFDDALAWARDIGAQLVAAIISGAAALGEAGARLMQGLWDGIKTKFDEVLSWVRDIPSRIAAAIGSIDLSTMIKLPTLPSWLGGGQSAPAGASPAPSSPIGGTKGFAPSTGSGKEVNVGGRIVVSAAPGTEVRSVQTTNDAVPLTPDRGAVLARP